MHASFEEGTLVAKGNHVVPNGVAVEELKNYGGHRKLKDECPPAVKDLLEKKDLFAVYDRFVTAVVEESNTRQFLTEKWKDQEFVSILDLFRDEFAAKGIKVALCKRKSGSGTYRWLEFIDVDEVGSSSYVPQYDVANLSGQVIRTCYEKIKFPNGVAVEELKQWGSARKRLKEKLPVYVEKLLTEKRLMDEYNAMVDQCIEAGISKCFNIKKWDTSKLTEILKIYKARFKAKGVDIFISHKQEYISHGTSGGHYEYYRWIEFVDREQQPNYHPQRDAESKDEKGGCVVC